MKPECIELPGVRATVDQVVYWPDLEGPEDRPHSFVYFITVHNESEVAVTLVGRKWVVTETSGNVLAVEGDGVVGQFPTIQPGNSFSYNSRHLIRGPTAAAEGSYLAKDALGRRILVRIPRFLMVVPVREEE